MKEMARMSKPDAFRGINDQEFKAISGWLRRGKISPGTLRYAIDEVNRGNLGGVVKVSYHRTQGGFTICTLAEHYIHPTRGECWEVRTGASRRSFKDPINPIKGQMLALFRAVNSKPVTLP